jgi:hypothetical protein
MEQLPKSAHRGGIEAGLIPVIPSATWIIPREVAKWVFDDDGEQSPTSASAESLRCFAALTFVDCRHILQRKTPSFCSFN